MPLLELPESAAPSGLASVVVAAAEDALELEEDPFVEVELLALALLLGDAVLEAWLFEIVEVEPFFVEVAIAAEELDTATPFIVPNPILSLS